MRRTTLDPQRPMASMMPAGKLKTVQRLVTEVEATSHALLRRSILSAIVIGSLVCLASPWLGAPLAQAQESPSHESGTSVTQPEIGQPSTGNAEAGRLVISMVDRSELESLPNGATQVANLHSTDQHDVENILLPSDSQGSEYASLAALASAPSVSLLHAIQAKDSTTPHTGPAASESKALIYRLGTINFVLEGLPSSFSMSSVRSSVTAAR